MSNLKENRPSPSHGSPSQKQKQKQKQKQREEEAHAARVDDIYGIGATNSTAPLSPSGGSDDSSFEVQVMYCEPQLHTSVRFKKGTAPAQVAAKAREALGKHMGVETGFLRYATGLQEPLDDLTNSGTITMWRNAPSGMESRAISISEPETLKETFLERLERKMEENAVRMTKELDVHKEEGMAQQEKAREEFNAKLEKQREEFDAKIEDLRASQDFHTYKGGSQDYHDLRAIHTRDLLDRARKVTAEAVGRETSGLLETGNIPSRVKAFRKAVEDLPQSTQREKLVAIGRDEETIRMIVDKQHKYTQEGNTVAHEAKMSTLRRVPDEAPKNNPDKHRLDAICDLVEEAYSRQGGVHNKLKPS